MQDSREYILGIAFKLFFQKGYKEVTMSDLVKESGLSKGAFYHYFSSKEELYNLSMEMFMEHYLENFQMEYRHELTLRENLKALFAQFSPISNQVNTSSQKSAEALSNYLIFLQNLMRKEAFRNKLEVYTQNFYSAFVNWIINAQVKGEIKEELDPMTLSQHFASLVKGIGVLHSFADQSEPVIETFSRIVNQFFDLIELPSVNQ